MNDMGLRQLVERTNALAGTGVRVGYQVDSGRVDGVDILDIAIWNQFGNSRIPPRPFMTDAAIKYSHDMGLLMAHASKAVVNGRVTKLSALQQLGEEYQKRIAAHIVSGEFKENAPSTIKKKKSAVPLVDQGRHLIPGLRWVIDGRAQTPRGGRGRV
jgi:hypothetical protein